jgi:hypothetical protein
MSSFGYIVDYDILAGPPRPAFFLPERKYLPRLVISGCVEPARSYILIGR